jgi:hypothetical protein
MVMSGSHFPITYFPSQEVEEETMDNHQEICHEIENMKTTSRME